MRSSIFGSASSLVVSAAVAQDFGGQEEPSIYLTRTFGRLSSTCSRILFWSAKRLDRSRARNILQFNEKRAQWT